MKLGTVTKIYKTNGTRPKKVDDNVMLADCGVIVIILTYGQFGALRKPYSGCIVCKTYIFINSNLLSYWNWKQNCKISNTALTLLLWVKVLYLPKKGWFFWRKKILRGLKNTKGYIQVSSIILTSFREGVILSPSPALYLKTNT